MAHPGQERRAFALTRSNAAISALETRIDFAFLLFLPVKLNKTPSGARALRDLGRALEAEAKAKAWKSGGGKSNCIFRRHQRQEAGSGSRGAESCEESFHC